MSTRKWRTAPEVALPAGTVLPLGVKLGNKALVGQYATAPARGHSGHPQDRSERINYDRSAYPKGKL